MRKLFLLMAVAAMAIACNNESTPTAATTDDSTVAPLNLPMPVSYSSAFKMGNADYASMIVQGSWKDWQDNKLDNMKNWIADTITAFHSNNEMVYGLDSMMAKWKRIRATYSSVTDTIEAVLPVYSADKKENLVLVWAIEYGTKTDGSKDTVSLMETWGINKDGKADFLLQYDRATRKH